MLPRQNSLISISLTHFDIVTGCLTVFEFHAVFLVALLSSLCSYRRRLRSWRLVTDFSPCSSKIFRDCISLWHCAASLSGKLRLQFSWIQISKIRRTICPIALHAIRQLVKITFPLGCVTNLASCHSRAG